MIAGSILVVENSTGEIRSSASYPLLYNENQYHIFQKSKEINDQLNQPKYDKLKSPSNIKIRFDKDYVNFSEFDMMPGSIVKPLLTYGALEFKPNTYSQEFLNDFLASSDPGTATTIFTDMFVKDSLYQQAKEFYTKEFGFFPYKFDIAKDSKIITNHAIGQQQVLRFQQIVQAYTRIKTGTKVVFNYYGAKSPKYQALSLDLEQLMILQTAMKGCLQNGTAAKPNHDVGKALKNAGVYYKDFLAKTGTAEMKDHPQYNKTTAFIIVTDDYTIGIQLFGVVPGNKSERHAMNLFIEIINELKNHNILTANE
jgi:cell division protein FtsI/penicillin-binding protein 2